MLANDQDALGLTCLRSIREFCDLNMPIVMFDKDGNFCVLRLEDVSLQPNIFDGPNLMTDNLGFVAASPVIRTRGPRWHKIACKKIV